MFVSCPSKKKNRGRSFAKLEAKDEAKKQKTQKNRKSDQTHKDTTRHRISVGNEFLYMDPLNKGIHGDENHVCL